jgi:arginine decarboxylase
MPILKGIKEYIDKNTVNFHMPGHKQGKNIPDFLKENFLKMDLTEIPGLDNLHYPESIIKEAQEMASKVFKSDKTYFLVNGTTVGIHAAILSVCIPGDKILVQRNIHKSVIGGMILSGAVPCYINPLYNKTFSIADKLNPNDIKIAIEKNPSVKVVVILNPSYYGVVSDLTKIVEIVHSYNKILIVDEAHGSHFIFNEKLPITAMEAGADISIQSAHKTLPSITQSSYLHLKSDRVDEKKIEYYLSILQTSSPSYLIMAFLDYSRYYMDNKGRGKLKDILDEIELLKVSVLKNDKLKILNYKNYDFTRLVINTSCLGISGFSLDSLLQNKYNIWPEMSDLFNVVFIATVADNKTDFHNLTKVFKELKFVKNKEVFDGDFEKLKEIDCNIDYEIAMDLKDVSLRDYEYVDLKEAKNRISYDVVTPYPPGIPALNPGEIIKSEIIEYLELILNYGGKVNGISSEKRLKIVKI